MRDGHARDVCPSCGAALVVLGERAPVRCGSCFAEYLRAVDVAFLEAYADFGCTSRRVVAEACLRELVLESPSHRKALAAAIFEQFVLTATDLIALYDAVRGRRLRPVIEGFLDFRLDETTASTFSNRLESAGDDELLGALGLPHPADVRILFAELDRRAAASLEDALATVLHGLRRLELGPQGAMALLAAQHDPSSGRAALVGTGTWEARTLDPREVATLTLDAARRRVNVRAVPTDERALAEVVDAIGSCSAAACDLIYALLTVNDSGALADRSPLSPRDE